MQDDTTDFEPLETPEETNEAGDLSAEDLPQTVFRVIDGSCPAIECDIPAQTSLHARRDSFLAKPPSVELGPSTNEGFVALQNQSSDTELLYVTPKQVGAVMVFDLSLHRQGLIIAAPNLLAYDAVVDCEVVLDVALPSRPAYRLYHLRGAGRIVTFMAGDLFPLTLAEDDQQQVNADLLAAMEPSLAFDLGQIDEDIYVAQLQGAGRIWMQSMPSVTFHQAADDVSASAAPRKSLFSRG